MKLMDHEAKDRKQAPAEQPRQTTRVEFAKLHWAAQPLPDPAYNPKTGWKLDEFAMYCEPLRLRKYKEHSFAQHYRFVELKKELSFQEYVSFLLFPEILKNHRSACNAIRPVPERPPAASWTAST